MKRIELHAKTKYSSDYDSVIDIEGILWNTKENNEKGIVFVDKDSILSFPKIEKIYNKLCNDDKSFRNFKIGYGVQISVVIDKYIYEVIILVKNQSGLKNLYKIMSLYLSEFNKKIPISEILKYKDGLLLGLIYDSKLPKDLLIFDYIEINKNMDISKFGDKTVVYSIIPNCLFPGDINGLEILYVYKNLDKSPVSRLYLDTEDTLKECDNKEIVVDNSNKIFDNLDRIIINDNKFYTNPVENFLEFKNKVWKSFYEKFKNPTNKLEIRLEEELFFIENLNYTYYFEMLLMITNYCKECNTYYQIDGYVNNLLVSYVLGITEIEPFKLPYELFFSEIPRLEMKVSHEFYYNKLFRFIDDKFRDKLLKCNYGFKLNKKSIPRVIKNYEVRSKNKLDLSDRDYVLSLLDDIPLYKHLISNSFYLIPNDMDFYDFTPLEVGTEEFNKDMVLTHFDYHDLKDNLIRLDFRTFEYLDDITYFRNESKDMIEFCNDKKIYNLFRDTEEFGIKFKYLDKESGLLNINYFDNLKSNLKNISNFWIDDLVNVLVKEGSLIVKDDLYVELTNRGLDDKDIFNVINYLKEIGKVLVSKSYLINKVRVSYMEMYYKFYYPIIYYKKMLSNISWNYLSDLVYTCDIDMIKRRYFDLNDSDKLYLGIHDYEELHLLEILLEMYERGIEFNIKDKKFVIKIS